MESWTEKLRLGLDQIDEQHREYFRRADRLITSCLGQDAERESAAALDFLAAYVRVHFQTEEALMGVPGYPERDTRFHKSQHAWFTGEISAMVEACHQKGSLPSSLRLSSLVVDWFQNHIQTVDRKLVEAIKSAGTLTLPKA